MGVKGWVCAKDVIWKELLRVGERGRGLGARKCRGLFEAGLEKNTKHHSIISANCQ
jgi:hypothetical protein